MGHGLRLIACALSLSCFESALNAQNRPVVSDVLALEKTAGAGTTQIEVDFDRAFATSETVNSAKDRSHYRVLDLGTGQGGLREIAIKDIVVRTIGRRGKETASSLVLIDLSEPITPGSRYALAVSGVEFQGGPVADWIGNIPFGASDQDPENRLVRKLDEAEGRDDADVFFAGEAGRSAGSDFVGALDIKIQYPWAFKEWGARIHRFSPTFEMKANSDPEADPNNFRGGLLWQFNPVEGVGPVIALRWDNQFGVEGSRTADTVNGLVSSQFKAIFNTVQSNTVLFYARPFMGIDLGSSIKAPAALDAGGVFRFNAGTSAVLAFEVLEGIELETLYERRQLVKDEIFEGLTLADGPRNWFETRLDVGFTPFLSLFIGYENGRKAPEFTLVKDRLRFGFIYKAKWSVN